MDPQQPDYADPPPRRPRWVRLLLILLLCVALIGGLRVLNDVLGRASPPAPPDFVPTEMKLKPRK